MKVSLISDLITLVIEHGVRLYDPHQLWPGGDIIASLSLRVFVAIIFTKILAVVKCEFHFTQHFSPINNSLFAFGLEQKCT